MNRTEKTLINKICAIFIIMALTISDFLFVGAATVSYALDVVNTNNSNVEFSAYFLNANGEKTERLEENIDKAEQYLYVDVSVKNEGYFNGTISLNNSNFNIKQEVIGSNIAGISGNQVTLNQINAGSNVTIKLGIEPLNTDSITQEALDQKTEVELTGQYINSKNVEKDKHIDIKGIATVEMKWKSSETSNAELESSILTNSVYEINGEAKRIVQILVNSKITGNNYPVKNTEITLSVPEKVEEVQVHARSTNATNRNISFSSENYTYDETNKNLTINLANEDTKNISWSKNAQDTLVVTYVFSPEENITNQEIGINSKIQTYDEKELTASQNVHIENEIDGIISQAVETTEESIYKGKIYTKEERDYTVRNSIYVDYLNVKDKLTINGKEATYTVNDQEMAANIIYKQTKIDKQEFLKIFGEEGYLTIKNGAGTTIANINKDSQTDENGKIVVNYTEQTKTIEITTSKPIGLGTIYIENTKTILDAGYGRETIDTLTGIKEKIAVNDIENTKNMTLKNTETVANVNMDVQAISTIADSQEVTLEATLVANDESKDLYKNPNITFTFPKEITILSARYAALYKNGLEIQECVTSQNENGQYQVNFKLTGEQTKYEGAGGTKIYLKLQIRTGKLTPSKPSSIDMTYTNENKNETKTANVGFNFESQYGLMIYNQTNNYNKAGDAIVTIDSESAYGTIDTNAESKEMTIETALINNYGQSVSNVTLIGTIPAGTSEETFKATLRSVETDHGNATISYSSKVDAAPDDESWGEYTEGAVAYKIELPEMGKEEVVKLKITTTLPENIGYNQNGSFTTKTTCYYQNQEQTNSSNIILATKANMTASTNEIFTNQDTQSGFNTQISAMIGNNSLAENDSVYENQTIKYKAIITNNTGKDYTNVTIKATQKNGYVWDLVTEEVYNPHYDTTSTEPYYQITDSNEITLGTIPNLKNGESYTYEYEASAYALDNEKIDGTTTYGTIAINSEDGQLNETATTIQNNIKEGALQVNLLSGYASSMDLTSGGDLKASLSITNTTTESLNDLEAKIAFSKDLVADVSLTENNREKVSYVGEEKQEDGVTIVTLKIASIDAGETIDIELYPYTGEILSAEDVEIWVLAEITTANQENYISNKLTRTVYDNTNQIEVTQQGLYEDGNLVNAEEDLLNDGDRIQFVATIANNEAEDVEVSIEYNLDTMINIESAKIASTNNAEEDVLGQITYNHLKRDEQTIKAGETVTINIVGTIDALETESITNILNVYDLENGKTSNVNLSLPVNTLQETEEPTDEEENPEEGNGEGNEQGGNEQQPSDGGNEQDGELEEVPDPDNGGETNGSGENTGENNGTAGDTENTYTISGIAWMDKNKDGKRNDEEEKVSDMTVEAMNSDTGAIVASTKTDSNGGYQFNLVEGNYIILFYYDNNLYTTTTYQVSGASQTENSDAVGREVQIDGNTKTLGTTDILTVNADITNIDIGLIIRSTFDLKIEKYVSKITVTNDSKTTTYEQDENTSLAKAEIRSKYINDSLVVIEYKIKVTNEGDVAGYARNIVDYMPSSLSFNSSLNSDWYLSGEYLYNTSLANTKIEAGETKELTLVLTKTMTETNTGLINNKAAIQESSNALGIEDETKDTGSADVIISVSTGALVNYVIITITTVIILASLAYLINRKYLSKRI